MLTYELTRSQNFDKNCLINAIPLSRSSPKHFVQFSSVAIFMCDVANFIYVLNRIRTHCIFFLFAIRNFMLTLADHFISFTISSYSLLASYIAILLPNLVFSFLYNCNGILFHTTSCKNELDEGTFFLLSVQNMLARARTHASKPEFNWLETFATRIMAI